MAFIALERLINFTDGYRKIFVVDHHKVLLIQEGSTPYAIEADCPHKQWSFLNADIAQNQITCPNHGASFSLLTGKNMEACNILCRPIKIYKVIFEDTRVGIDWQD